MVNPTGPSSLVTPSRIDSHPPLRKFAADGKTLYFPGNTIISHLTPTQRQPFCALQRLLPVSKKLVLMPDTSIHMTTIELVTDAVRTEAFWSSRLRLDLPLSETDALFQEWLAPVAFPPEIEMVVQCINVEQEFRQGIQVFLKPKDEKTAEMLAEFRNLVAKVTGVRRPNHDNYQFHVTLAYVINTLQPDDIKQFEAFRDEHEQELREQVGVLTLPKPALVFFKDMLEFLPELPDRKAQAADAFVER